MQSSPVTPLLVLRAGPVLAFALQAMAVLSTVRETMVKHTERLAFLELQCAKLERLRLASEAQTETIQKLKEKVSELQEVKASKAQDVSNMLTKVEAVAGGPKVRASPTPPTQTNTNAS